MSAHSDAPKDERHAWHRYLNSTRSVIGWRYEEIEPWAWQRLQKELLTVHKRRPKVAA